MGKRGRDKLGRFMASVSLRYQVRTINIYNRATTVFQKL